jgi:hypothetical protein
MLKRISPREVLEAFKSTGLLPVRGSFGDGEVTGCGLSALCLQRGIDLDMLAQEYGRRYLSGFTVGWDNAPVYRVEDINNEPDFLAGYHDGYAARLWAFYKYYEE